MQSMKRERAKREREGKRGRRRRREREREEAEEGGIQKEWRWCGEEATASYRVQEYLLGLDTQLLVLLLLT